ncbi:MAG: S1 RNA-binding domain-containing protein [Chloroflexota bacterium]
MTDNSAISQDINRKEQLTGKVIKISLAGAVIDIGKDKPAVLHISKISKDAVKRVEDVLKVGQEVNVWINKVRKDTGLVELTMLEPLALDWHDIKKGMVVSGKVTRLEKFGAFIEVGAERPGLAHISELTHDYVRATEDAVKVGQEVEAKVLDFNRRKKQIKLSLKAMQEAPIDENAIDAEGQKELESQEPALTAMEIAYRDAMGLQDEVVVEVVADVVDEAPELDDASKKEQEEL